MQHVLSYILKDILKAQATADHESMDIAKKYREHPLLVHFRVPHVRASEVKLDLKFGIKKNIVQNGQIHPDDISSLGKEFSLFLLNTLQMKSLSELFGNSKAFQDLGKINEEFFLQAFILILKKEPALSIQEIIDAALELIKNGILNIVINLDKHYALSFVQKFLNPFTPLPDSRNPWLKIRNAIAHIFQVVEIVKDEAKYPNEDPLFSVVVDSDVLSHFPPEAINTTSVTVVVERKEWVALTHSNGSQYEKLVSS